MKSLLRGLLKTRKSDTDDNARVHVEVGRNDLGLMELAPGHEPVIDIVAVHGLNGHREKSWTDEKSNVLWLRDLLPDRVPNARIMTFGYDADTLKLSKISHLTVNDHATSLIVELLRVRRDPELQRRPILFLAHSLGGIVVKHALVTCHVATHDSSQEFRSIKVSTYGVHLMPVPTVLSFRQSSPTLAAYLFRETVESSNFWVAILIICGT